MNPSDDYKAGESFGHLIGGLTGEIKVLTSAIGELKTEFQQFKGGIGPRLEEHDRQLTALETNRTNDVAHITAVTQKVDRETNEVKQTIEKHIDGHWKWVAVLVGLLTIFTVLVKMSSKF